MFSSLRMMPGEIFPALSAAPACWFSRRRRIPLRPSASGSSNCSVICSPAAARENVPLYQVLVSVFSSTCAVFLPYLIDSRGRR